MRNQICSLRFNRVFPGIHRWASRFQLQCNPLPRVLLLWSLRISTLQSEV